MTLYRAEHEQKPRPRTKWIQLTEEQARARREFGLGQPPGFYVGIYVYLEGVVAAYVTFTTWRTGISVIWGVMAVWSVAVLVMMLLRVRTFPYWLAGTCMFRALIALMLGHAGLPYLAIEGLVAGYALESRTMNITFLHRAKPEWLEDDAGKNPPPTP